MENNSIIVSNEIASFLIEYDIFKSTDFTQNIHQKGSKLLNETRKFYLLCGYSISLLLHKIGTQNNIDSSYSFQKLSKNDTNQSQYSSADIIFIWNNLVHDLKQHKITLDNDTKLLIIAGDISTLLQLIQNIFNTVTKSHNIQSISTESISSSSRCLLPQIQTSCNALNPNQQKYSLRYKLQTNNRFFKLLCHSFSTHFFISYQDAQRILLSEKHLIFLFNQFKFYDDITLNMKQYKATYDTNIDDSADDNLTWLQIAIRTNLLQFMHERKSEMTTFISKQSRDKQAVNPFMRLLSSNSHNTVKREMIYLLELFRFGLIQDFKEDHHLSVVFNAYSAIHAILRTLHSISSELLEDLAEWFVNNDIFSLLAQTILSLKDILKTYDETNKQKTKILSHIGYEIWNIISILSTNNQSITFMSIFDTYLARLFESKKNEYFNVMQYLFQLLQISLSFAERNKSKHKIYCKHLRLVIKKLQSERILDYIISNISCHLFSRPNHAQLLSPSSARKQRLHYERLLGSERESTASQSTEKENKAVDGDAIDALSTIWLSLSLYLELQQKETILNILKKLSRSKTISIQTICVDALFKILYVLATHQDIEFTPKIYKLLIFHLVENHGDENIRDIMLSNFISIIESLANIPVHVFIEPLVRQTAYYGCCSLHFDLFHAMIEHKRIHLKESMLIIHLIGKICVTDSKYHVSACQLLVEILEKYQDEEILREYCQKYFKVIFSNFVQMAQDQHLSQIQSTPILLENNFNKMEISIKTLINIAKLNIESLNTLMTEIIHFVIQDYVQLFGNIHPLLKILYTTLSTDTIDTERYLNHEIAPNSPSVEDVYTSAQQPTTPEINEAIQAAKQKYIQSLQSNQDMHMNDNDENANNASILIALQSLESSEMSEFVPDKPDSDKDEMIQRALDDIKKSKAKYESQKTINTPSPKKNRKKLFKKQPKAVILKKTLEINQEIRDILFKYRHIFQMIVNQYRGIKPSVTKAESFDDMKKMKHMLSLAEYTKIFEDYQVSPALISKIELKSILSQIALQYGGNMCTFENFMDSLLYIAHYAKGELNNNALQISPSTKLTNLLLYMKTKHKENKLKPNKLWSVKPPNAKPPKHERNYRHRNNDNNTENVMEEMENEILYGSDHETGKKQKKSRKKRSSTNYKEFYKKQTEKKRNYQKYLQSQQEIETQQKRQNEKREIRRKRRMNELKINLQKLQNEKRVQEEEKEKKLRQTEEEKRSQLKEKQKRKAMHEKKTREKIAMYKKEKMQKMEIKKQEIKEEKEAKKVKLSKKDIKKLKDKRQKEIIKAAEKRKLKEIQIEEEKKKEQQRKNAFLKPLVKQAKSSKDKKKQRLLSKESMIKKENDDKNTVHEENENDADANDIVEIKNNEEHANEDEQKETADTQKDTEIEQESVDKNNDEAEVAIDADVEAEENKETVKEFTTKENNGKQKETQDVDSNETQHETNDAAENKNEKSDPEPVEIEQSVAAEQ